jgi:L-rhamnose-H+ transport protein
LGPNPLLGVLFHWLGGLASGSFYVPYRGVKVWAWETYWLVGGFFSWILAPWILALWMTNELTSVLREAPSQSLFWAYTFGVLWGLGGLTFGLTMRYLGMSLGMAVALGYTAAFGTLMPPIFRGQFATEVLGTRSGLTILAGVGICMLGIIFAGIAGVSKETEMSEAQKRLSIREFNLKRGLLVATFSGVMSACFAYGLAAGDPIKEITVRHGTPALWQGLPVLVVVLLGGFTTNIIWCVVLNVRNGTGYQYFTSEIRATRPSPNQSQTLENVTDAPAEEMAELGRVDAPRPSKAPMTSNYLLSALAGTTWYFQFFFYTMGETQMGRYKFSSWTLHMASIIIFSSLWGIGLKEWRGAGIHAGRMLALALALLVGSTVIVGYGNYLGLAR